MHLSEFGGASEVVSCYECPTPLTYGTFEGFQIDADRILCFECAVRRGGKYDPDERRWQIVPRLDDL